MMHDAKESPFVHTLATRSLQKHGSPFCSVPMLKDPKRPAGPRAANTSPTRLPNASSARRLRTTEITTPRDSMLSATSNNNHSLFQFGRNGRVESTEDYEFLPSVSFDELQSSLETASTEFQLTQFPSPTGQGSILDSRGMNGKQKQKGSEEFHATIPSGKSSRTGILNRSTNGSILRRPSTSDRQAGGDSVTGDAPPSGTTSTSAPATRVRSRHYPPVSSSNPTRQPRISTGSGGAVLETTSSQRHSLNSNGNQDLGANGDESASARAARLTGNTMARIWRATEANTTTTTASTATSYSSSDQLTTTTSTPRSPVVKAASKPSSQPAPADRRKPPASGLGAKTISPTDTARDNRRRSMMPPSHQSLQQLSSVLPRPSPSSAAVRDESRSPSLNPGKTSATPSSSRTTPDISATRKSYGSGLSTSSTSYRTSTGSLQRGGGGGGGGGLNTAQPSSRLPTPKSPVLYGNDDDEDVPPVPAIPKAYESPKASPADFPTDTIRKPPVALDTSSINSSINSSSTGSASGVLTHLDLQHQHQQPPQRLQRRPSARKSMHAFGGLESEKAASSAYGRNNLQPLRLPPFSIQLDSTTSARIAALRKHGSMERMTSSPSKAPPKTPTTPMTASKSSFFSHHRSEDPLDVPNTRSSSSTHHASLTGSSARIAVSPTEPLAVSGSKESAQLPSISPFLSTSLSRSEFEPRQAFSRRLRADTDRLSSAVVPPPLDISKPPSKSGGARREQNILGNSKATNGKRMSSPDEPQTPSSMSSIRRKLSASWKRNASKSSVVLPQDSENSELLPRHDSMLLPRKPKVDSTESKTRAASPSPSTKKKLYLESRRRKSSAASLFASEKQGGGADSVKKEAVAESATDRITASRGSSVMHKILKPKASASSVRSTDPSVAADMVRVDISDEEMKRMGLKRKGTELAARTLDNLRKRATRKEGVNSLEARRIANLNIYERGEVNDYDTVYFCGTEKACKIVGDMDSSAPNHGFDDDRGDYTIIAGDHLCYRYEIVDVLGKGSFGQVVRCIDHKKGDLVAIKIIRNKKRFHQQALVEVNILTKIREWDPRNRHSMVQFTDSFYFRGHLCISTELLDMNLYELIKANSFQSLSLNIIRRFTKQILSSLNLLKQHRVIHCDLKPENILLRHPLQSEIKVIDFGSSCFENEKVYTYIQSRFYRSPEVILGMTYGMPIDMWSLGCILAELYTGVPIFPGEDEKEQLACIMEVFGPPEKHLIEKSTRKKLFFDSMGKPRLTVSSKGGRRRPSSKTLQQVLKCHDEPFLDFVARCLRWDPDRRLKPEDAIRHEYITGRKMPTTTPRLPVREASPMKRSNTTAISRPLPEPPGGSNTKMGSTGVRPREVSGMKSPHKAISGATTRRTSSGVAVTASKRASLGGTSSLPRPGGVRASNQKVVDLASAGAAAAMNRRG